jgi:uncharacterized protein (TIGR02145 family)
MKLNLKLLVKLQCLLLVVISFSACKKNGDGDDNNNDDAAANVAVILNMGQGAVAKYQESLQANKDSIDAFLDMSKWVIQQPDVDHAIIGSMGLLEIYYKSGLTSIVSIEATDAAGNLLYRGGGNGDLKDNKRATSNFVNPKFKTTGEEHTINNKKVLVFNTVSKEFYNDQYPYVDELEDGNTKLQVTQVNNVAADLSVLSTFKDYGFIILNTHGMPQGFLVSSKVAQLNTPYKPDGQDFTNEEVRELFIEANGLPIEKFANRELLMAVVAIPLEDKKVVYMKQAVIVTDRYIRNLPRLENAIVFGNYCYSGWTADGPTTNNMAEAFKSIGAVAYYGYAFPDGTSTYVPDEFAKKMEGFLINSLVQDGDSTGVAHLLSDLLVQGTTDYQYVRPGLEVTMDMTRGLMMQMIVRPSPPPFLDFLHFFDPRYRYGCGTLTDARDQEVYSIACIGDQQWMAENLRYNAPGSLVYDNNNANLATYGRLYHFSTVTAGAGIGSPTSPGPKGICPQGWHVPSKFDYDKLIVNLNAMGGTPATYGYLLKAKSTKWNIDSQAELDHPLRNKTGFSALPSGQAGDYNTGIHFFYEGEAMYSWASSPLDNGTIPNTVGVIKISGSGMSQEPHVLGPGLSNDIRYYSCRCVKD